MDSTPGDREMHPHGGKRLQLRIAGRAIGTHRRAIWEQAKHYTWWLATLAIALMVLGTSVKTGFLARAVIIMIGCIAGAVIALIALGVVRREVEVLDESYEIYDKLAKAMDLEGGSLAAPGRPNKGLGKLIKGACGAKKTKMETWDWFQFSFVLGATIYFVGFVGMLVYAILK
jgi:hypothetical protein